MYMMVNDGNTLRRCNAIHISSSCIKQICFPVSLIWLAQLATC